MRQLLSIAFALFTIYSLQAQDFSAKDIRYFSGIYNSHDQFHEDHDGNKYIGGSGTGEIDFDFSSESNLLPEGSLEDLYLAKYDANFSLDWLLSFDGSMNARMSSITTDENGNVYIIGSFEGKLNLTNDGQNEIDAFDNTTMFIAKFDAIGNLQWKYAIGNGDSNQLGDYALLRETQLIVQLSHSGTFDVDPGAGETTLSGNNKRSLLVFDLDGNITEVYTYAGASRPKESIIDSDGNLYICGNYGGLASFDFKSNASVLSNGIADAFIAKYDSDFNLLWLKTLSKDLKVSQINEIALNSNEDIVAEGSFAEETNIGNFVTENDALHILNISKDGNFDNVVEIFDRDKASTNELALDSKDQIIITTTFEDTLDIDLSSAVFELYPISSANKCLLVYNSNFELIGSNQIYGPHFDTYSFHIDTNDQITILTDFIGEGKVAFGSSELYTSTEEQDNFVSYVLDLEKCSSSSENVSLEACNEVEINGIDYTTSGVYEQALINAEGCDSILTIALTIYPDIETSMFLFNCGPYTFDGEIITNSGVYTALFTSENGCDSLVVLELSLLIINEEVTINGNELVSEESQGDFYQWYDCDLDQQIENANDQTYSPSQNGSYRVQVFREACSIFSGCVDFILLDTDDLASEINITPNPTNGIVHIKTEGFNPKYKISVFDISGRILIHSMVLNSEGMIDLNQFSKGIYILKIENNTDSIFKKIILN